jgi:hypothetical protein
MCEDFIKRIDERGICKCDFDKSDKVSPSPCLLSINDNKFLKCNRVEKVLSTHISHKHYDEIFITIHDMKDNTHFVKKLDMSICRNMFYFDKTFKIKIGSIHDLYDRVFTVKSKYLYKINRIKKYIDLGFKIDTRAISDLKTLKVLFGHGNGIYTTKFGSGFYGYRIVDLKGNILEDKNIEIFLKKKFEVLRIPYNVTIPCVDKSCTLKKYIIHNYDHTHFMKSIKFLEHLGSLYHDDTRTSHRIDCENILIKTNRSNKLICLGCDFCSKDDEDWCESSRSGCPS